MIYYILKGMKSGMPEQRGSRRVEGNGN